MDSVVGRSRPAYRGVVLGTTAGSSLLFSTLVAFAPPSSPEQNLSSMDEGAGDTPSFSVALDSVFSLEYGDFGASSTFRFGVRPRPHFELSATAGVAHEQYGQQNGAKITETRASNLMLGVRWVQDDPGRRHHGYVGLSLVLPTDVDGKATQFQSLLAKSVMRMRGGWDAWLWLPSTNAVVVPFGWRWNGARGIVGIDGALAGLAHVHGDLGVAAQLRVYGGLAVGRSVLGLGGSAAYDGLNGRAAAGLGAFVHTPLCKPGQEDCSVQLSARAGVGLTHEETVGLQGPMLTTGIGVRWGSGTPARSEPKD